MTTNRTLEHILFLARHFDRKRVRQVVIMILLELNIPTQYEGFDYLVASILLCVEDAQKVFVSGVYTALSDAYNQIVVPNQAEQAIRRVISVAWKDRDPDTWDLYFSPGIGGKYNRPSNMVFISKLARVVELWTGCREVLEEKDNHLEVGGR